MTLVVNLLRKFKIRLGIALLFARLKVSGTLQAFDLSPEGRTLIDALQGLMGAGRSPSLRVASSCACGSTAGAGAAPTRHG